MRITCGIGYRVWCGVVWCGVVWCRLRWVEEEVWQQAETGLRPMDPLLAFACQLSLVNRSPLHFFQALAGTSLGRAETRLSNAVSMSARKQGSVEQLEDPAGHIQLH